jgi:hypothetical protein
MSYDRIKFIPEEDIEVPTDTVEFGPQQQLNARVFKLRDSEIRVDEEQRVHLYDHGREIGVIWFDTHIQEVQDCVVLGRNKKYGKDHDEDEDWYILFVTAISGNQYTRLGVGRVKSRYLLQASTKGILI